MCRKTNSIYYIVVLIQNVFILIFFIIWMKISKKQFYRSIKYEDEKQQKWLAVCFSGFCLCYCGLNIIPVHSFDERIWVFVFFFGKWIGFFVLRIEGNDLTFPKNICCGFIATRIYFMYIEIFTWNSSINAYIRECRFVDLVFDSFPCNSISTCAPLRCAQFTLMILFSLYANKKLFEINHWPYMNAMF